jgi:hypothetical protein
VKRMEGAPRLAQCYGCGRDGVAGTIPYASASTGGHRQPEVWFDWDGQTYCAPCAEKLTAPDPSRAVNQFYADTRGVKKHSDFAD